MLFDDLDGFDKIIGKSHALRMCVLLIELFY